MYLKLLLTLLVSATLMAGCSDAPPERPPERNPVAETATRDSALALLRTAEREALQQAFQRLEETSYTRSTIVEQLDTRGNRIASIERRVRHASSQEARILSVDSSGRFRFGWLDRFTSGTFDPQNPSRLPVYLGSEDPAYLSERNREAYRYRILPDTVRYGRPTRVVLVRARPGADDEKAVRQVRLYIDRESNQLVALNLVRQTDNLLFSEKSRLQAEIAPVAENGWKPATTQFDTQFDIPFQPTRTFRTASTFEL